ncbi:MAG: nucleotidyltransferase family protein [Candidatus Diapherotrites archaeon]|nr:nucleotidyltransferase family protein [Candidatus Diapherotrites archaeon]
MIGMLGIKKAFILAGGKGERLMPLTLEKAKPILPVLGKPILEWNIELCRRFGVKEIVLALGYKAEQIQDYFGDGSKMGLKIHYNIEKEFLGTAGALKFAEDFFKDEKKFIMMNGDEVKDVNFKAVNETHMEKNAFGTIALTRVNDASDFGGIELDAKKILAFREKDPLLKKPGVINSGAYILSNRILEHIPSGRSVSIEKETFPKIASMGKLFGCEFSGQWYPTDTFERYEKAQKEWKGF